MLQIFDPTGNFWEANPGYKIPFSELYKDDKSKKKEESSKIMWSIALLVSDQSPYKELPDKEKKELIKTDYISINWDKYQNEINLFIKLNLSKVKQKLKNWETKLEERDTFIGETTYDADTYEMLDKMMAATDKMWKQYISIMEEVIKEDTGSQTRGGSEESASEKFEV